MRKGGFNATPPDLGSAAVGGGCDGVTDRQARQPSRRPRPSTRADPTCSGPARCPIRAERFSDSLRRAREDASGSPMLQRLIAPARQLPAVRQMAFVQSAVTSGIRWISDAHGMGPARLLGQRFADPCPSRRRRQEPCDRQAACVAGAWVQQLGPVPDPRARPRRRPRDRAYGSQRWQLLCDGRHRRSALPRRVTPVRVPAADELRHVRCHGFMSGRRRPPRRSLPPLRAPRRSSGSNPATAAANRQHHAMPGETTGETTLAAVRSFAAWRLGADTRRLRRPGSRRHAPLDQRGPRARREPPRPPRHSLQRTAPSTFSSSARRSLLATRVLTARTRFRRPG